MSTERLLSEIQSRYRSDRWNPAGDRFGYIKFDPIKKRERELNRMKKLEAQRLTAALQNFSDYVMPTENLNPRNTLSKK